MASKPCSIFSRLCLCLEVPSCAFGNADALYSVGPLCRAQQVSGEPISIAIAGGKPKLGVVPTLVCGHLEGVYLEKNNNLFYSCWGWKTPCPPERARVDGF